MMRFYVKANFFREDDGEIVDGGVDLKAEQGTHLLKDVPALLNKWIFRCEEEMDYDSPFTIELFLPFSLLDSTTCDPHVWELKDKFGNKTPISMKYPLVFRSYDRLYEGTRMEWHAWKRNWDICQAGHCCMHPSASCKAGMLDREESDGRRPPCILHEQDYDRLKEDLHMSLSKVGCLRMTFVSDTPQDIFCKMIGAGTCVALWPRSKDKCPGKGTLEEAYHKLLPGFDLSRLPEKIWEQRCEGRHALANHITLFWDDPNRVPMDSPYRPDKKILRAPRGPRS